MWSRIHDEGFIFFDNTIISQNLKDFLLNPKSYEEVINDKCKHTLLETTISSPELIKELYLGIPSEIRSFLTDKEIFWSAKLVTKGFKLWPHNDAILEDANYRPGPGLVNIWFCPDEFEGREFVYGKVKELKDIPAKRCKAGSYTNIGFEDPNLEYSGIVKPKTGLGVLIGRTNPVYWHGVKEMISDSRVISIIGYL